MRSRIPLALALLATASTEVLSAEPLAVLGPPIPTPPAVGIVPIANGIGYNRVPAPAPTDRTSVHFGGPAGLKVTWQLPNGTFDDANAPVAPKEYNFRQGQTFRLRATVAPTGGAARMFYPTLEVAPATAKSRVFLAHASVPVGFSADDFARAADGESVVKVVYLPDPAHADFGGIVGAEEVTSYRLEPGTDPVEEARRRGTILAVVRLGGIEMDRPRPPGR